MGSCVFYCDVPYQKIAQRQVSPVSVYCDGVWCHVLCLRHGFPVWQHIGQRTTATRRYRRDLRCQSDVKPQKKQKVYLFQSEVSLHKCKISPFKTSNRRICFHTTKSQSHTSKCFNVFIVKMHLKLISDHMCYVCFTEYRVDHIHTLG